MLNVGKVESWDKMFMVFIKGLMDVIMVVL